jgi:hypothetical protein
MSCDLGQYLWLGDITPTSTPTAQPPLGQGSKFQSSHQREKEFPAEGGRERTEGGREGGTERESGKDRERERERERERGRGHNPRGFTELKHHPHG